jgi:hypothetical protein
VPVQLFKFMWLLKILYARPGEALLQKRKTGHVPVSHVFDSTKGVSYCLKVPYTVRESKKKHPGKTRDEKAVARIIKSHHRLRLTIGICWLCLIMLLHHRDDYSPNYTDRHPRITSIKPMSNYLHLYLGDDTNYRESACTPSRHLFLRTIVRKRGIGSRYPGLCHCDIIQFDSGETRMESRNATLPNKTDILNESGEARYPFNTFVLYIDSRHTLQHSISKY